MIEKNDKDLPQLYDHLIERAAKRLKDLGSGTTVTLQQVLEEVGTRAIELGELTREEMEQLLRLIHNDLHDAARYGLERERDFTDWLRLDALLIEKQLHQRTARLVDMARQEARHAGKEPRHPLDWHTGEVTGIGSLECRDCGQVIHFYQAATIPPCPKCHSSHFHRNWPQ